MSVAGTDAATEALALAANIRRNEELCGETLGTRRTVALVLAGLGVAVPIGIAFVGRGVRRGPVAGRE